MKKLLLGNAAVARGAYEAGVRVVSSYPGTPSTEITEQIVPYKEIYAEWAPNEKVAAEVAIGASIGGARAMSCMKHVGLNVMADPVFTVSYSGVNGGLVFCVADDPGMHSSQNEQDSRHYAEAAKIPMLEPSDSAECKNFTKLAYTISETFDAPAFLRLSTRVSHSQSLVELEEPEEVALKPYEKDAAKYVMMPANAIKRHVVVEERMRKLAEYAETCPINRVESKGNKIGVISAGIAYLYAKEALGDQVDYCKLGMIYPMPKQMLLDFAAQHETVYVIEELDPFIETYCRSLGISVIGKEAFSLLGEYTPHQIRKVVLGEEEPAYQVPGEPIPVRPPVMCAGCPHRGLFFTLSKNKCTVLGDIGCYTLGAVAPLSAMEMTLCMGASISSIHGFNKALGKESEGKTVAVIGDSTFMHSGMTGLANIAYNQSNSTVIILDNSITGMTGHQQNPTTGYNIKGDPAGKIDLESLCRSMGFNRVRVVDPYDLAACDTVIKEELAAEEPSVIISRRPCALLKYVKHNPPLKVEKENCVGCKSCMRLGCPAISVKDKKAVIDTTLCVGCGVCQQLCKFDALQA